MPIEQQKLVDAMWVSLSIAIAGFVAFAVYINVG